MAEHARLARRPASEAPAKAPAIAATAPGAAAELLNAHPRARRLHNLGGRLSARQIAPLPVQAGSGPTPQVVQRLVLPGLDEGTKVRVIRSTSLQLHNAPATIVGAGDRPNEYRIRIDGTGEEVVARGDQLVMADDPARVREPIEANLAPVLGTPIAEVKTMIADHLESSKIRPKDGFAIGGSFAALLHAAQAGAAARTPRDIDIVLSRDDFRSLPPTAPPKFCGLPIEFHQSGTLVQATEADKESGVIGAGTLLAAHMLKLRDDHYLFKTVVPKTPKPPRAAREGESAITAAELYAIMAAHNDEFMRSPPDEMSLERKKVWMKTLADLEALAHTGARAPLA